MKPTLHPHKQEMQKGLAKVRHLHHLLGNPSSHYPTIHIAGTNGKGSVATKIASTLQAMGKKTALYTSPHLFTFRERIQINGSIICAKEAAFYLYQILQLMEKASLSLTFFEIMTLLAFLYFAEKKVDIAVIEVGMGGRLDATNIISPLLSVITSIAYDHSSYLGDTLDAIAQEKAGIIKPLTPIVIGPHAIPLNIFEKVAHQNHSPLYKVEGQYSDYEKENRAIATVSLQKLPFPLSSPALEKGIQKTPACRFEILMRHIPIVLDVAHNPQGMQRTLERFENDFPNQPFVVLAAFSLEKDACSMLCLLEKAHSIYLTQPPHKHILPLKQLHTALPCLKEKDPSQAFHLAYKKAQSIKAPLLITGTFFLMREIYPLLDYPSMQSSNPS